MTGALPAGSGRKHLRLFDNQYSLLWDSATANTPAYQHIASWVHATIDYTDGTRWFGQMYRCPEGIKRWTHDDLVKITAWANPLLNTDSPM